MNENVLHALDFAQGPVFRAAFALMIFGALRALMLGASDAAAAYVSLPQRAEFWRLMRQRLLWFLFPSVVLRQTGRGGSFPMFLYHLGLCCCSLVLRLGVIIVPAFMAAHVYLWERNLGVHWPVLPGQLADTLAVITIVAGFVLFLGRLYSPQLRKMEPKWSFFKPLILILPFLTGFLAMHPQWSPLDWHFVMLLHVLSACIVFVMLPFGRMLTCIHTRLTDAVPEAAWLRSDEQSSSGEPLEPAGPVA